MADQSDKRMKDLEDRVQRLEMQIVELQKAAAGVPATAQAETKNGGILGAIKSAVGA